MKKIMHNKLIISLFALMTLVFASCENEEVIFDGDSVAQFNGNGQGTLVINPSEDTQNTFEVGVTASTNSDRTFTFSVSEESTLDPSYYSISGESGVIPAGEYTGEILITSFATSDFPPSGAQLILNLESVEGTDFMLGGDSTLVIDFLVACEFDPVISAGTYQITADGFDTSVGDLLFEVVAGPEANQVTMISPFDHINPETGEADYDIVIDVDPATGAATINRQAAWHCDNFGCGFGEGRIQSSGSGFVFSCLESMQFNLTHTVDAGSFGTFSFAAEKVQ